MKCLIKIQLTLFTLFFGCDFYAQKGFLKIDIYDNLDTLDQHVSVQVLQNDIVQSSFYTTLNSGESFSDSLKVGFYTIKIVAGDNQTVEQNFHKVEIKDSQTTTVYFDLPDIYYTHYKTKGDTSLKNKSLISFHILTGNNFINDNDIFNSFYEFGFKFGGTNAVTKNLAIGGSWGTSLSWTNFNNQHSISPLVEHDKERYFYWDFDLLLFTRLSTYNNKTWKKNGVYLDVGVSYSFPVIFRYVLVEKSTRTIRNHIHRFNDFSGLVRLGYKAFGLTYEHRLTNFLKHDFPEQPKIKVGISFIFEQ